VSGSRIRRGADWSRFVTNYAAVGVLLGLIVFFSIVEPETFPTVDTAKSIVTSESVLAIVALAAIVPLVVGEFDLSIANNLAFSAVLTAKLVSEGVSVPLTLAIVFAVGVVIGLINAALILRIGISSFITTLGTSVILAGLTTAIAGGATIFEGIGESLTSLGNNELLSIPIGGFYVLVIAVVLWYVLAYTPLGRHMYATGYGRAAAQLAGIRTGRLIVLAFAVAGLLAAAAGALHAARIGSASPGVGGTFLLPAFAAAFLGATTIRAGRFNVWGTILGVILLAVGITGLRLMGVPQYAQDLFNGAALIVAVGLAAVGARRARAGAPA
jgi:ribose transport system permease protein